MVICRFLLLFFLLTGPSAYAGGPDPNILLNNAGCPQNAIKDFLDGSQDMRVCVASNTHLICLRAKNFAGIAKNPQSVLAVTKALGLANRQDLYEAMALRETPQNLQDARGAGRTLANGRYYIKGIQFLTFHKEDRAMSASCLPLASSRTLQQIYSQPKFIHEYCATLLPEARDLMSQGKHSEALRKLKEMHDLKFADADAYLLAMRAFIHENEPRDAARLGTEILADLAARLDAGQAEQLGDLFMRLDMQNEAREAYGIASKKLIHPGERSSNP